MANYPEGLTRTSGLNERVMTAVSFGLLIVSCVDDGLTGLVARIAFLVSLVVISLMNFSASFGLLLSSVAIYNPKHVWGPELVADRVDTGAFLIVFLVYAFSQGNKDHGPRRDWMLVFIIAGFILLALSQAALKGLLDWAGIAEFTRAFILPFVFFLILRWTSATAQQVRSFSTIILLLGICMALVSVLERLELYSIMVPPWVGDRAVNGAIEMGRSGGLLMQPEFNGFALGLIYCLALGTVQTTRGISSVLAYASAACCLVGIYFSYTRAAWIAVAAITALFMFKPAGAVPGHVFKRVASVSATVLLLAVLVALPVKTAQQRAGDTDTIHYRFNLWAAGLNMVKEQIVFGHGIGQFEKNARDYKVPMGNMPEIIIPEEGTGAHNIFLSIAIEQGIAGLVLYLAAVLAICRYALASVRLIWPERGALWVTAFSLLYFMNVQFLNAHEPFTNLLYFGTMGLIAGLKPSE